jgi:hypothetical protein
MKPVSALALLCVVDLVLTITVIQTGLATEWNPLLANAQGYGGLIALAAFKLVLSICALWLLLIYEDNQLCRRLTYGAILVYLAVIAYTISAAIEVM